MENICTCDIETASDGRILDINLYNANESSYYLFSNWDQLINHLADNGEESGVTRIFAHNGGNFDWVGLACDMLRGNCGSRLSKITPPRIVGGCIIMMELWFRNPEPKRPGYKVRLLDSFRMLPASLNSLAHDFLGESKIDVPDDYISRMEDFKRDFPVQYSDYHKKDAVLLAKIIEAFEIEVLSFCNIKKFPATIGGLALKIFQQNYMEKKKIIFPSSDMCAFEALAYKGGFTQYVGAGQDNGETHFYENVNSYDVNSMYPATMLNNKFPTCKGAWVTDLIRDENGLIESGVYEAEFEQTAGQCPILQIVDEKNRNLDYAWAGRGFYTHHELNCLEQLGKITRVHMGIYYEFTEDLFSDFVRDMYTRRAQARDAGELGKSLVYKLLMNNLYGKFGERDESSELCLADDETINSAMEKNQKIEYIEETENGTICIITKKRVVYNRFPAIAAMVTALGRIQITDIMNVEKIDVIYSDTDSIKTQQKIPEHYLSNTELGKFKLEAENETLIIINKKGYIQYREDIEKASLKLKGVPIRSRTLPAMLELARGGMVEFSYRSPTKILTTMKRLVQNPYQFVHYTRRLNRAASMKERGLLRNTN